MRSVECPDAAAAGAFPRAEEVRVSGPRPAADSALRHRVSVQAQPADSDRALEFAPLVPLRARADSRRLVLRTAYSCRGHFFPATTVSSGSTVDLDLTIFIIISVLLAAASDASRPSSAPDSFWEGPSILLTTMTTTPITMEHRRRRNRLS